MIFDRLENIGRHKDFNLSFISKDLKKKEFGKGRFEIKGNEVFGIDLEYTTKNADDCLWEGHRKYLDIHIILEGEEIIHVADVTKMSSVKDYEHDYELFEGEKEQIIYMKKGYFLVLFPNEIHKTSIIANGLPVTVRKKVYKKII